MALQDVLLSTKLGYRAYMQLKWGIGNREAPRVSWMNTALQNQTQVDAALAEATRLRLPPCPDRTKNWDTLAALEEVLRRTGPSARVLDAGAELYSRFLPWLYLYGYRRLHGNNLVFTRTVRKGDIVYEPGDITRTRFEPGFFDAIACLSVVEHGVDLDAYFREMSRILKPGGVLVTSTDYFETPTDTSGQSAYGVPIRIFTKQDMVEAITLAERHGLQLTGPADLGCESRVVNWQEFGLDYTFVVVAMTKVGG